MRVYAPPGTTFVEWAVRWTDSAWAGPQVFASEDDARNALGRTVRGSGEIVRRTRTVFRDDVTEWATP